MSTRKFHPGLLAFGSLFSVLLLFCLCLMNAAQFANEQEAHIWRTKDPIQRQRLVDQYRDQLTRLPNSMFYALDGKPTVGLFKRFDHQGPSPN